MTDTMNLKLDPQQFDKRQKILVEEIATAVKIKLMEAGLETDQVADLTSSITFSVSTIIDDMAAIESDGTEVMPYLTFRTDDNTLLHYGENSCTNEFVYEVLKKMFG